ncbi:uncharacterized protein DUF4091 [Paenibacillus taihuensis]|uniref:Uncharacterized protein DUF4091 n=1 Tax=Paenibacillus taihuensis TaxID=1156355 RepID=A0A3D9RZ56_9BACL|nr:DUF4091 domain-containing protein [Paenibacillus taihuensis]REE85348.1 uncharacterized protein DUF4091 [Paenibacillus taihuensis]
MSEQQLKLETRCLHSLAKVFADEELQEAAYERGSALRGEYYSFQVAYRTTAFMKNLKVAVKSGLAESSTITVKSVGLAPSELPNYNDPDDYLLRTTPGLYPDPLYPLEAVTGGVHALPNQWRSVWVTVQIAGDAAPGKYPVEIEFTEENGEALGSGMFELEVIGAELPEQQLVHTEWFYLDCLASWYKVETFSEAHWQIIEKYVAHYVESGMNMILTPLFSPPLELDYGKYRPTVQLVGVKLAGESGAYTFDFTLLERWVEVCLRNGVKHFEYSHLFTQWGAKHAPKIFAEVDGEGEQRQIFGWETDAEGEAYLEFLTQFIPALVQFVKAHGLERSSYFHLSDEPGTWCLDSYTSASTTIRTLLKDEFPIIDALSEYDFYKRGLLTHPVVSTEHIHTYIENNADNLWAYYCCCEYKHKESNRFFNMPSARNRIIGVQLYKYDIQGFLHWGYNHWYAQRSRREINPFQVTDADMAFPSGDAFLVYPGEDGPISSIRLAVLREALQDIRALRLLESLTSKQDVVELLEAGLSEPITFRQYERGSAWLLAMRERVNRLIAECVQQESGLTC